jgi:hypothetical protein
MYVYEVGKRYDRIMGRIVDTYDQLTYRNLKMICISNNSLGNIKSKKESC